MTRPTELPEWATSGANVLEPSSGKKLAGFLSGERPPAQWFNWLHGLAGQWVAHLDEERARTCDLIYATQLLNSIEEKYDNANDEYLAVAASHENGLDDFLAVGNNGTNGIWAYSTNGRVNSAS